MTNEEFLIRYSVDWRIEAIRKLNSELDGIMERCTHSVVDKQHKRIDSYGEKPDFYTNFHCKICDKRWIENGSK